MNSDRAAHSRNRAANSTDSPMTLYICFEVFWVEKEQVLSRNKSVTVR